MFIADLHIHSRFSRATSRDLDAANLDLWARRKGIGLIGTGDFTHPAWRQELVQTLVPAEEGLFTLRSELSLPCEVHSLQAPRFILSGEISTIYKRGGKTRKVHHVILLPSFEAAETLSHRLEAIGNLHSDGRPILGLDSRDLLEITLECCPNAIYIPAHIWTPHFSLFGAFSGFETVEECYADMSPYIHALETGLSSDPMMNRRLSMLDGYTLVSNSDAHSPSKLGREANLFDCELNYASIKHAIETGYRFGGTIEFYPEEGKYHLDGHRNCRCCLEPSQTVELGGLCPICGKKVTVGVLHRIEALADRDTHIALQKSVESLIPLPELLADCMGLSPVSKKVTNAYHSMLAALGCEFDILRKLSLEAIENQAGHLVAEGVRRLREGRVIRQAGYDGEYGIIRLFEPGETERLSGQTSLLELAGLTENKPFQTVGVAKKSASLTATPGSAQQSIELNPEQKNAAESLTDCTAVIAGPGTGKTKTLVSRITYLIEKMGIPPSEITAVTFTRQAAAEMTERLTAQLGKKAVRGLNVGTFHAICMKMLDQKPIITRPQAQDIIHTLLVEHEAHISPGECLRLLSLYKNNRCCHTAETARLPAWLPGTYAQRLETLGLRDLDDVLLHALQVPVHQKQFNHLLVDEFQDINASQHALISHWSSKCKSLFIIGDPDQAIYGFRGAQSDCFDTFASSHPNVHTVHLTQNYRSSPQILDAALNIIQHNPGPERILHANASSKADIRFMKAPDSFSEAAWIAKEIARMAGGTDMLEAQYHQNRSTTYAFSEIAILCRTNHQLEQLEVALAHNSIPCIISGHDDFLSDRTVQGMLGFFASMLDRTDSVSLHAALDGLWRIPAALIQPASVAFSHTSSAAKLRTALNVFPLLRPWLEAVNIFSPLLAADKPRKLFEHLSDYCQFKSDSISKLLNAAVFHDNLVSLLNNLRLDSSSDIHRTSGAGYENGAVKLMTLHGSKGLEFPVVFLAGLTEGIFPPERIHSANDLHEERRLFYVGITRAREELICTCGGKPSFFAKELPETIIQGDIHARNRTPKTQQLTLFDF